MPLRAAAVRAALAGGLLALSCTAAVMSLTSAVFAPDILRLAFDPEFVGEAPAVQAHPPFSFGFTDTGATAPAPQPGAPVPNAALGHSVRLRFNDDFNIFSWSRGRFQWNSATKRKDWIRTSGGTWTTQYHWGRTTPNNNEQEYYSDASVGVNPFRIQGGALVITAAPSADPAKTGGLPYTSGVITTHGSFAQKYGYFEMRADLQPGQGLWPAFWLLNEDQRFPPELDVMEVISNDPTVHHNLHSEAGGQYRSFHGWVPTPDLFDGYHTFGVSWRPDVVEFYVDGRKTHRVATPADLHSPMYLIANLAVGGNWPGAPDGTTRFPAEMKIDYIRAWQYEDLM